MTITSPLRTLAATLLALFAFATLPAAAQDVPKEKQTALGKYLTAKEAYDTVKAERAKVLFIDVRTSAELMFVGSTDEIDAHVPFAEMTPVWDEKSARFHMGPNANFVAQIEAAAAAKGLNKSDKVVLMCRSGERSARAVNALAAAGFTNAYSQIEGFEGDMSKEGRRSVNGWKNAGLPWGYKLDKAKPVAVAR